MLPRLRRLSGCFLVLGGVALSADTSRTLVLADVTVIDGRGGSPVPHVTLVIADGRIAGAFPLDLKPIPSGASVLNVRGQYVIPGLVDAHVHLTEQPGEAASRLALALQGGVTTLRDMGGDAAWLAELSETTGSPLSPAPRVYFAVALAGPTLLGAPRPPPAMTSSGAFSVIPWLSTFAAHTPVRRTIALVKSTGARGIKIYSDVPNDLVRDLAAEAHREGLKVWGHARIFPGRPHEAVEAGLDAISHSSMLACEESKAGPSKADPYCDHDTSPGSEPLTRLFTLMRERRTILEPTLAVQRSASVIGGASLKRARSAPILEWGAEAARRAHEAGVRIVAGSDLLFERGALVPSIHDEMELLVTRAGLTPLEAITAATRTGAEVLGLERTSGTLEVGKQADLVVLSADPTRDIRNTRSITHVVKAGHLAVTVPRRLTGERP